MGRSFAHRRQAALEYFELLENHIDRPNLSDVTSITVQVGDTVVYSTAYNDGPVRWNTSELKQGEIVALVPTSGFTRDRETAQITIVSPTYPTGFVWASQTIAVTEATYFGLAGPLREQCDVCGRWFPVMDLIRQTHIRRRHARTNALYSSRYATAYWELDGADYLGEVSMGRSRFYWKPHTYKNANIAAGACSFWGDAELISKESLDLSGYCTALLRGRFGTHQTTRKPGLTVEFGFYYDYGGAGETRYSIGTREFKTHTAWVVDDLSSIAPGHLTALQPFYKVTTYDNQQIWWGEDFRLQKDESTPGMTNAVSRGTPIDDAFAMVTYGKTVVCPDHRQFFEKRVNEYEMEFEDVETVEDEDEEW